MQNVMYWQFCFYRLDFPKVILLCQIVFLFVPIFQINFLKGYNTSFSHQEFKKAIISLLQLKC